jgi:hypothetical protein
MFASMLPWGISNSAEPLGRLFFTPEQRNALDAGKELARPKQTGPDVRGPRSLKVNGIVTRSDGESTVWVNGRAAGVKSPSSAAISASASDRVTARVQVPGISTKLRVGQSLNRSTGRVTEAYQSTPSKANRETSSAPLFSSTNHSDGDVGNPNSSETLPDQRSKPDKP